MPPVDGPEGERAGSEVVRPENEYEEDEADVEPGWDSRVVLRRRVRNGANEVGVWTIGGEMRACQLL